MANSHAVVSRDWRENHLGIRTFIAQGVETLTTIVDGVGVPGGNIYVDLVTADDLRNLELLNGRLWFRVTDPGSGDFDVELVLRTDTPLLFQTILCQVTGITGGIQEHAPYIPSVGAVVDADVTPSTGDGLPMNQGVTITNDMFANIVGSKEYNSRISLRFSEDVALVGTVTVTYLLHLNFRTLGV